MTRAHLVAVALQAYPVATRRERGDEMTATLLDASAGSGRRFLSELGGLIRAGLGLRASQTARAGARRVVADGLCMAGVWFLTLDLSILLSQRLRGIEGALVAWPSILLLGSCLVVALLGGDRVSGLAALVWTALRTPVIVADHHTAQSLAAQALPLACFAIMVLAPRHRAFNPRGLIWLVVPACLVAVFGAEAGGVAVALVGVAAILAVCFAVWLLPTDPRPAIAGALPVSALGVEIIGKPTTSTIAATLLVAAAPVAIAIAVARAGRPLRTAAR